MNEATWSGTQALYVIDGLTACVRSKMVKEYFDEGEQAALQILLEKAIEGHALAVGRGKTDK